MSGKSGLKLPTFSRSQSQGLEAALPPSVIPEHVRAPPATPTSNLWTPNNGSDNDTPDEGPHTADSHEHSSSETHQPRSPGGRKPRKRGKKSSAKSKGLPTSFRPSLVLENAGSVARDHLASERTFLAYIRTSLLLASSGVALVQLFAVASANVTVGATLGHVREFARPLGATMVIFGLVVLTIGVRRYFLVQTYLTQGKFPVSRFAIAGISIVTAIIIIIVFGVLVSARN